MKKFLSILIICQLLIPSPLQADQATADPRVPDTRLRNKPKSDSGVRLYDDRGTVSGLTPVDTRAGFSNRDAVESSYRTSTTGKSTYQPLNPFVIRW